MGTKSVNLIVQGDVFLHPAVMPKGAVRAQRKPRGWVLAEGEHTGHAHAVVDDGAELYEADGVLYLRVDGEEVALRHEEHKPVFIPKGDWRVGIVREYDPFLEETRRVAD